MCGLGAGFCACCRRTTQQHVSRDATGQTTLQPDHTDDESYSPTHNHLPVEGHDDLRQGQVQGHCDECNKDYSINGEAMELTIVKGKEISSYVVVLTGRNIGLFPNPWCVSRTKET